MDNIQKNDFIERGCLYISEEKFIELKSYTVDENDILISRAGTVGNVHCKTICKQIHHQYQSNSIVIKLEENWANIFRLLDDFL